MGKPIFARIILLQAMGRKLCNLPPLSPSLGYGNLARPDNIGSMEMEGFEALFRASPIKKKDLNVDMSLSYSWNDNTVKKMGDPVFDNFGLVTIREGYPKYSSGVKS